MIRIIHISDFHQESDELTFKKDQLVTALLDDMQQYVNPDSILVFSGDLIDKGGKGFSKKTKNPFLSMQNSFLNKIVERHPLLKEKIFIVPGNHDIQRDVVTPIEQSGMLLETATLAKIEETIKNIRSKNIYTSRLEKYKAFESDYYQPYKDKNLSYFENSFIVKLNGTKVGISCFNSSWLCYDESDKGKLVIGEAQIERSLKFIKDCAVKIAITHHPLEHLSKIDYDCIYPTVEREYDMHLSGHVHNMDSSYRQGLYGDLLNSISRSTVADHNPVRKYINGYSIIDYTKNHSSKIILRQYVETKKAFVPDNVIGDLNGEKIYASMSPAEKIDQVVSERALDFVKDNRLQKLDDHLIVSVNNKSLGEMFVHPTISNFPISNSKIEAETKIENKKYLLSDLLEHDDNFIIYGAKEAGKTVLLDRILLLAHDDFKLYKKVPVIIPFSKIEGNNIEGIVKEYLGLNNKEYKSLISKHKLLILVDDIIFDSKYEKSINLIGKEIESNSNIQVICTSTQIMESTMPKEYLDYEKFNEFNLLFIQNFGTKEIRQLITKWFEGKKVDYREQVEKLIKNFQELSLPRTPLAISLFLWIFEKQENKPINNAVLVEMFVENLLEKTNFENLNLGGFDFHNKQRLLAFSAKFMLDKDDFSNSYQVLYDDLLDFYKKHLKGKFEGNIESILKDFIKRGIFFCVDEKYVKFKSAFFFHYFLAKYIDIDSKFKDEVFTGDNYLDYINELDYFTGLKRDSATTLDFLIGKLNETFSQINKHLENNFDKIDGFLEINDKEKCLSADLTMDSVKTKPTEEEIDKMYDEQLSNSPSNKLIEPKGKAKEVQTSNHEKILKITATVLKNSDEIDDFEKRKAAYQAILTSSISFMVLYKANILEYYRVHKAKPDFMPHNFDFNLFIRALPLIHQVVVYNWLGTPKLLSVLREKIEVDKQTVNITEFEKFMSVFIFSDIKGKDYHLVVQEYLKGTKRRYLNDLGFIKLMSYYFLRSKTHEMDRFYILLMADVKERLGLMNKKAKSDFIQKMEKDKQLSLFQK
ncbi:MAG: metallophosphoesterase [Bacteroidetes bacterium]|nr:metallophosphoesterase [Bacteroidota bacterium]